MVETDRSEARGTDGREREHARREGRDEKNESFVRGVCVCGVCCVCDFPMNERTNEGTNEGTSATHNLAKQSFSCKTTKALPSSSDI